VAVAAAGTCLALLAPLPRSWRGGWQSQFLDFGHVPLFAGLTVALWAAFRGPWYRPALVAIAAAALAEVVQPTFGRSGDLLDFLRGGAGALAAAALIRFGQGPRSWGRFGGHALAALALLAWPAAEAAPRLLDAYEGGRDFPTLADFEAPRRCLRWQCQQANLDRVASPSQPGAWAGRVELLPGPSAYPGAQLEHVRRDWRGYRRLCWSFTVEGGPLALVFSVRGGPDARGRTNHFQFERTFAAGEHQVDVALAEAAARANPDRLDLSDIWWSQVFTVRPSAARVIYLHRVWLE
jgi:hypothetical protein